MGWTKLLGLILSIAQKLSSFFQEKQLLEAGRAEATKATLETANAQITKADEARAVVHDDIVRHPERLRDDDGFKRPD